MISKTALLITAALASVETIRIQEVQPHNKTADFLIKKSFAHFSCFLFSRMLWLRNMRHQKRCQYLYKISYSSSLHGASALLMLLRSPMHFEHVNYCLCIWIWASVCNIHSHQILLISQIPISSTFQQHLNHFCPSPKCCLV